MQYQFVIFKTAKIGTVCVDDPNDVFVAGLVRLATVSQCRLESSPLLRRLQGWVSNAFVVTKSDMLLPPWPLRAVR